MSFSTRLSIADLAQTLRLSPSTVSRALSGSPDVSAATRQRVRQLAAQLRYQPHPVAVALRKGHNNTLGALLPHSAGKFFAETLDGITEAANQAGYNILICPTRDDALQNRRSVELMTSANIAGLLVALGDGTYEASYLETLRTGVLPLVFLGQAAEGFTGAHVSAVQPDDYAGAYAVVAHLLAEGYRRIAHLAGPLTLGSYHQRHQGYCQALADHGLPLCPELVASTEPTPAAAATAVQQLLQAAQPPDAIFCSGDLLLAAAFRVLKETNRRVPADLALAGFSDAEWTTLTDPPLPTVDQRSRQLGRLAVGQLLKLLQPGSSSAPLSPVLLSPHLLINDASRRAAHLATS